LSKKWAIRKAENKNHQLNKTDKTRYNRENTVKTGRADGILK